jgi:ABC-type cobalamin transport system permease subunit
VLIVILVAMIIVGAVLLRLFRVPEAGNLSFLGVAITSVVILVFLIKYLFSPWMFAVVPVLSAFAFALARWVTTRWTDDGDGDPKTDYSHDVR